MTKKTNTTFEQQLFKAADKLRKNIDAAEYKYVVLGLVFIKYISETFNELYEKLEADEYSDPEDRDEYLAENVFFVPATARWSHIHNNAKNVVCSDNVVIDCVSTFGIVNHRIRCRPLFSKMDNGIILTIFDHVVQSPQIFCHVNFK